MSTVNKRALITGIAGQDGSYLSELLLEKGYKVYGIIRRKSIVEENNSRIEHLLSNPNLVLHYGDLLDRSSLIKILESVKPQEIYNLGAQSDVGISFDLAEYTVKTNALGVLNLLESTRQVCPTAKVYQASSSEQYGNSIDNDGFQRETTPMHPVSPYGCAKLFSYHLSRHYRLAYNMFIVNGILFNHCSPRRGENFVTKKIVKGAAAIYKGKADKLKLGNLDSSRDEGHSKDYVRAMYLMIQHHVPSDWVVATGQTHTIREFCKSVFDKLDLDYKEYIQQDTKYMRPHELNILKGDASRTREILGWTPLYSFDDLVDEMIQYELKN